MRARTGSGLGGHALLLLAVCGFAAVLAPASCTLDVQGTGPDAPGTGGTGPGVGGMGPGAGGMGTSTSSSSSSVGGSGGQGGVNPPPPEECLDGVDNDMDGLTDCADVDDCAPASYECVPEAPGGWDGNVRAVAVPAGDMLPDCAAGETPMQYLAGPATETLCAGCSCTLSGAACSAPEVTCWWGNGTCQGSADFTVSGQANNTCSSANAGSNDGSCQITGPAQVLVTGQCALNAGSGELTNPESWAEDVRVCISATPTGGGCDAGQVCVPRSTTGTPDLDGAVCITRQGTQECPAGWTDVDTQLYTTATDDRTCSACSCGQGATECTGGGYTAYDFNNCTQSALTINTTCTDVTPRPDFGSFGLRGSAATPTAPTCTGGAPSGSVTPDGAVKLCCHAQPPPPPPQ